MTTPIVNDNMADEMSAPTELYARVEAKLGRPLAEYVAECRAPQGLGSGQSWRRIALSITQATGIDLTGEALRTWFVVRQGGSPERVAS